MWIILINNRKELQACLGARGVMTIAFCPPSTSDSNSPLVACQPTHVRGSLNNISGGDFLSCDALDTTCTTSSDHKCHDTSLSSMNESVSDA